MRRFPKSLAFWKILCYHVCIFLERSVLFQATVLQLSFSALHANSYIQTTPQKVTLQITQRNFMRGEAPRRQAKQGRGLAHAQRWGSPKRACRVLGVRSGAQAAAGRSPAGAKCRSGSEACATAAPPLGDEHGAGHALNYTKFAFCLIDYLY